MDSHSAEVVFDFPPFIRIYKDGHVERLAGTETIPASATNLKTSVSSKDIIIVPKTGVSARLFIPNEPSGKKLPLLVYIHGGAFCIETPFSPTYDGYVSSLVAEAKVIAVSVHYRRAPEHPLPIAYDDTWAVLEWVASHSNRNGPEAWLNEHADFSRVSMVGDSAGANIAHDMALRAAETPLEGVNFDGLGLIHPLVYWEESLDPNAIDEENKALLLKLWLMVSPTTSGCDDPLLNPATCANLHKLACKRVMVCVAEKDRLRCGGLFYHKTLGKSGWGGELEELMESEGEDHVFHLFKPTSEKALAIKCRLVSFLNHE